MNEDAIQRAVFRHFRQRGAPGVFAFHPKNGGIHQRGRRAGINAGLGVVPGVPDIVICGNGKFYALELKKEGGKLSADQVIMLEHLEQCGAIVEVAYGLDEALRWLEQYGLLIGKAAIERAAA